MALQYKINAYKKIPVTQKGFEEMTPLERGHHVFKAREAKDAANRVYDALFEKTKEMVINDPESIRGWYMTKGREINSITSTKVALKVAVDMGIPSDDFYARATITTAAMEKLAAMHLKVKDPKQWVKDTFSSVIRSTNARASLRARKSWSDGKLDPEFDVSK